MQDCDQNSVSISVVKKIDGIVNKNLDELDQSFMYTQILKEILLTIPFEPQQLTRFTEHCRNALADNENELKNVIHEQHITKNTEYSNFWNKVKCNKIKITGDNK